MPPIPPTSESSTGMRRADALADVGVHPVGRGRDAAADRLADDEHVGIEAPRARRAGRPGADRVGLVDDEDRVGPAGELADRVEIAGLGQHDPDVRQRGLDEHGGDIAVRERGLRAPSTSLNSTTRVVWATSTCGPTEPRTGTTAPVLVEHGDRLVDRAVVAVVVDDDLAPAGDVAGEAEREPVRVRGRQRELPGRQPEPPGELLAGPDGVLGREHVGDAAAQLALDGGDRRGRAVAGHRAGVAEAEVDVVVAVDAA